MMNDRHERYRRQWFFSVPMINHHRQGSLLGLMIRATLPQEESNSPKTPHSGRNNRLTSLRLQVLFITRQSTGGDAAPE
jgi:hypothetical protein